MHFFNTFFYKKLTQRTAPHDSKTEGAGNTVADRERAAHDRVKKWTKHVDIFAKARRDAP